MLNSLKQAHDYKVHLCVCTALLSPELDRITFHVFNLQDNQGVEAVEAGLVVAAGAAAAAAAAAAAVVAAACRTEASPDPVGCGVNGGGQESRRTWSVRS